MFRFFVRTIPENILSSFLGKRILLHVAAITSTFFIVSTGFDWTYLVSMRSLMLNAYFFPAVIIGGILPIILPLVFILGGVITKRTLISGIGWMLAQAALLGSIISSTYKAFTGRVQPNLSNLALDSSHGFHFGFMQHGVFWGWPSSHTTIAFSMAIALVVLFPRRYLLMLFVIAYAFYIGFGVSLSIHWFSEFIAGALIGSAIGLSVGKSFRERLTSK